MKAISSFVPSTFQLSSKFSQFFPRILFLHSPDYTIRTTGGRDFPRSAPKLWNHKTSSLLFRILTQLQDLKLNSFVWRSVQLIISFVTLSVLKSPLNHINYDFDSRSWCTDRSFFFCSHIVDHQVHDGLGNKVPNAFVDDGHVRVHQVANGFHFPLQLRVHGEIIWGGGGGFTLHLHANRGKMCSFILAGKREDLSVIYKT